ncbi:hypothetical protein BV898_11147 [Hypsibius exemplaris]|uniref:Uncharacterized protein n=1 Tax=Hypsibius exemplaris TaxID=2072580 RepID=A0A1W0WHG0_HYPEX|nr:hypothetical protein BV898_11147 [Hypsibius exemplaris]
MSSTEGPFLVRYFSDGTYDAYRNCKTRGGASDEEEKEVDPVWGHVLSEEPIKGTWETTDGFFNLEKDGQRTYVGSVYFEGRNPDGSAGSWEGGSKGREWVTEDGNMAAVGPALFRGLAYSGTPGGKLKAEVAVGKSQEHNS